jgi:hypothetical protein
MRHMRSLGAGIVTFVVVLSPDARPAPRRSLSQGAALSRSFLQRSLGEQVPMLAPRLAARHGSELKRYAEIRPVGRGAGSSQSGMGR